jgi:hypothetical protein
MHRRQLQPAMGGIFFADKEDFSTQIEKIRRIAEGIRATKMPEQISVTRAKELITRTLDATGNLVDKAIAMTKDITNVFVSDDIAASARAVQRAVTKKIIKELLVEVIQPAVAAGRTTVPSSRFGPNISSVLLNVVFSYEALQQIDAAKPFIIRNMPATLSLIAKIGSVVIILGNIAGSVASGLKEAVEAAASGTRLMIEILKWGSIAGGLYLLYGALKPEKGKKS